MPVQVDHEERRERLAQAVWRIVAREGVRGASVRGVAREAGLSMGSVRHFFASQDELLRFAVQEIVDQAERRIAAGEAARLAAVAEGRPVEAVAALLEEVLPLDEERLTEAKVWAAFTTPPTNDPVIAAIRQQADDGVRQLGHDALAALAEFRLLHPGRDLELEAERVHALIDGLTMHLMLDPTRTPPDSARAVLLAHLRDLRSAPVTATRRSPRRRG